MTQFDVLQLLLFVVAIVAITPWLGGFMARVFEGKTTWLHPLFSRFERWTYRVSGVDETGEMGWKSYALALLALNGIGILFVMGIQMIQAHLPLNPQAMTNVAWHSALNTAVSFVTNTNWQGYSGEVTMSYFTQMVALTVQNFLSAATGIAVAIALMRGIARRSSDTIGNFWVDLTRCTLYLLLPASFIFALILVGQGVVQTFAPAAQALTLEGAAQTIPLGPVASQVAIKMIGTNGGGFFNANAAHPFENPTALSNFLQMLSIFAIGAGLTYTYGTIARARRHGWLLLGVMLSFFLVLTVISLVSEYSTNPLLGMGGVMEGKETRFGVLGSVLFSTVTTSASCGAVNAMHSSLSPLSGGVALLNMMLGEIIVGGVGAGFYGMMLFVLLTVFISGLMVGRTPEYQGKKVEAREMMLVILAVIAPCATILLGTAIAAVVPAGLSSLGSQGPHGFSEILYAFTSAAANNGSAFAGLSANTPFYNLMLSVAMLVGRFAIIVPVLAVAGGFAAKKSSPPSSGTLGVDTGIFAVLLVAVILIVGALTFLPALSLGPVIEHLMMVQGRAF